MKKIFTVATIVLLLALCFIGILLLGNEKTYSDTDEIEGEVRTLKESVQLLQTVSRQDIVIDFKVAGLVSAQREIVPVEVELGSASAIPFEKALDLQGKTIKRGDIIAGNIKAPFNCKVDRVFEKEKKTFAYIVNYEDTFIEFWLPQEHLKAVAPGDTVSFSYNGDSHIGKIIYISQYVTDGTVNVWLSYDDPNCEILLNSSVEATIVLEKLDGVIVVPQNALKFDSNGNAMVKLLKDNDVQSVFVECGKEVEDGIIIESGLYDGATIVLDN